MDFGAPGVTQQVRQGVRVKSWISMDKHAGFGRADPRGGLFFPVIYPGSLQRQPEAPWKAAGPEAWQENPARSSKQESFDIPGVRNGEQGEALAQLPLSLVHPPLV